MVKSIVSALTALFILIGGFIYEQIYVKNSFVELRGDFIALEEKISNEIATQDDVLSMQKKWIDKKQKLHAVIPHSEIKEIDLWISEAVFYSGAQDFKETEAKVTVVIELLEQIPKTFLITFENIF